MFDPARRIEEFFAGRSGVTRCPARLGRTSLALALFAILTSVIQLSNSEASGRTTLSGASIADFESFNADGLLNQALVTVGYFWRF